MNLLCDGLRDALDPRTAGRHSPMAAKTDPLVHMGTITGGEAREILAGNPVLLLPMGSHEDQGPHAPMGDYLLAEKIAELAAIRASKAGTRTLVAPVLPFGGADWFGSMTGGIAISQATLTTVIAEMVDSLHRNGLTRIIVINGHGGMSALTSVLIVEGIDDQDGSQCRHAA
eukprot:gene46248-62639_t